MRYDEDPLRQLVSVISGGSYSLSLTTIDQKQIIYNGKFSYLNKYTRPHSGGWCHLLLLRSKNRYSKQFLAIITQTPDCDISIVNTIENIATFTLNFFNRFHPSLLHPYDDDDDICMVPENTIFIEYLPARCFRTHKDDTIAVMNLSWEEIQTDHLNSYYQATGLTSGKMWNHTNIAAINDLIARL
jgi:hypothetical protein